MQVESDVDYVKMLQKNITKFEFCAALQGLLCGYVCIFIQS